jgi:predicted aldo/keto reductase-like oxidoreductase
MQYTQLGNTNHRVSRLGFGSMRLPMVNIGGKEYVDAEQSIAMFHRAFELGVNYVDTGFQYCNSESEFAVGDAISQWPRRDEIVVAAKCTKFGMQNPGDLRRMLEHQLWKQRRDYFDYYLFHGIGWDNWHEIDARTGWIEDMARAKAEGLVKHVGFSFHDKPENMIRLIDEGMFELVTCQYNYLDRANEQAIAYAQSKNIPVVVMGPVGGGRLSVIPRNLREAGDLSATGAAELALRFVLSTPGVSVAISGMGSVEMVEQNCAAVDKGPLSEQEVAAVNTLMDQAKELARLYCTGCQYCLPCPNEVNIPRAFEMYNYYRVYGLEEYAVSGYRQLTAEQHDASVCAECGTCLDRCPQHIDIPGQLREVAAWFAALQS